MARHTMTFIATVLGLFFIYNGFGKLNPTLNSDLHLSMKKHFVNYARVAPLRKYFDKRFKASDYRQLIGGMEIAGGTGMVLSSGRIALPLSQLVIILASSFMIHTHIVLGDPLARATMLIATTLMVVVQMVFNKFVAPVAGSGDKTKQETTAPEETEEEKEFAAASPTENNSDVAQEEKPKAKKSSQKKKRKVKSN